MELSRWGSRVGATPSASSIVAAVRDRKVAREAVERRRAAPARRARPGRRRRGARSPRRPGQRRGAGGPRRWSTPARRSRAASHSPIARTDRQPLGAALADRGGDRPCVLERRRRRQLDVERDQRRPGGDQHRAGGRVEPCGPKSGRSSPARSVRASCRARRGGARRGCARRASSPYRNTGSSSSSPSRSREHERLGARGAPVRRVEVDDRRDVDRARRAGGRPRGGRGRPGSPPRRRRRRRPAPARRARPASVNTLR